MWFTILSIVVYGYQYKRIFSNLDWISRAIGEGLATHLIEPIPLEYDDDFYDRWSLDYPETTMKRGLLMKRNVVWQFFVEEDIPEASIQNYIVKQAKTNGHFFEWLFDDDALSDVPLDKLDHTHLKDGYGSFIHLICDCAAG